MDEPQPQPGMGSAALATIARSRVTRVLTGLWWALAGTTSLLAYVSVISDAGAVAPIGGAVFVGGMCVIAAVARNASAEAREPGSVRRGSLARTFAFGVVVHGGLLASVTIFASSALGTVFWVMVGGFGVAMTRPTTLVALGATTPLPPRDPATRELSVPQIVGELQAGAALVRNTNDPARKAALAERRGQLIEMLAERDPDALALLLDDSSSVRPTGGDGPDGPQPV